MPPFSVGPVNGFQLRVKAGSPDPVITRHLWPAAATVGAAAFAGAAGRAGVADATGLATTASSATAPVAPAILRTWRAERREPLIPPPSFPRRPTGVRISSLRRSCQRRPPD